MGETTPAFHHLLCAISGASVLLEGLPEHRIPNERTDLILRSFSFLCHAAIEEYLENVSVFVLERSIEDYHASSVLSDPVLSALSYYKISFHIGDYHAKWSGSLKQPLDQIFVDVLGKHKLSIEQNNGIRTSNQDAILVPIGVRLFDSDRILSQLLESFGVRRGELAHRFRIQLRHPKAALISDIGNILSLVEKLDRLLNSRIHLRYT